MSFKPSYYKAQNQRTGSKIDPCINHYNKYLPSTPWGGDAFDSQTYMLILDVRGNQNT